MLNPNEPLIPSIPPTLPDIEPDTAATLIETKATIDAIKALLTPVYDDIRSTALDELQSLAKELDDIHGEVLTVARDKGQDCEATANIVCQKIRTAALAHLYTLWETSRALGADIPPADSFHGDSPPGDPAQVPLSIPHEPDSKSPQKLAVGGFGDETLGSTDAKSVHSVGGEGGSVQPSAPPFQQYAPQFNQFAPFQASQIGQSFMPQSMANAMPSAHASPNAAPQSQPIQSGQQTVHISSQDFRTAPAGVTANDFQRKPTGNDEAVSGDTDSEPSPQTQDAQIAKQSSGQVKGEEAEKATVEVADTKPEEKIALCEFTEATAEYLATHDDGVGTTEKKGRGQVLAAGGERDAPEGKNELDEDKALNDEFEILRLKKNIALHISQQAGCKRFDNIRSAAIAFGKCMMEGTNSHAAQAIPWHSAKQAMQDIFTVTYASRSADFAEFWQKFSMIWEYRDLAKWNAMYLRPMEFLLGKSYDDAICLRAAVNALEAMDSMDIGGSRSAGYGKQTGKGAGGGVGGSKFGVSGSADISAGSGTQTSLGLSISVSFHFAIVPIIDLIRSFADRENNPALPSISEIQSAFLRGGYTKDTYDCLMRLHSASADVYDGQLWASRNSLTALEYIQAARRGIISDGDADFRLQENGYIDEQDRRIQFKLFEQIPPFSDIITMMVRDVEDPKIVERFELDAEFGDKYKGKLKDYAKAQGLTDDVALRYWRAHWRTIGIGQAYEMLHRQREHHIGPSGEPLETTIDDIKALLAQDDVPQFWRERLIDISYALPGRVDLRRMRQLGIISYAQLIERTQDLGYASENAVLLADYTEKLRRDFILNSPIGRRYSRNEANSKELQTWYDTVNATGEERDKYTAYLEAIADARVKTLCSRQYRKRYLKGEWSQEKAREVMIRDGFDANQANRLISAWACESFATEKALPASQLCDMYSRNLLTVEEFRIRLIRLGYSAVDAARIIAVCEQKSQQRLRQASDRSQSKLKADAEKAAKQLEQRRQKDAAMSAKEIKRVERENKVAEKRRKQLRKVARLLADITGETEEIEAMRINNQVARLIDERSYSQMEAEGVVIDAAKEWEQSSNEPYEASVNRIADANDELLRAPDESDQAPTEPSEQKHRPRK